MHDYLYYHLEELGNQIASVSYSHYRTPVVDFAVHCLLASSYLAIASPVSPASSML
jgi:hypothetical protein